MYRAPGRPEEDLVMLRKRSEAQFDPRHAAPPLGVWRRRECMQEARQYIYSGGAEEVVAGWRRGKVS